MNFQTTFTYQYKDHTSTKLSTGLGNNRLSFADSNGNGKIDTPRNTGVTVWEDDFEDKSTANGDWDGSGNSWGWPITDIVSDNPHSGTKSGMLQNTTTTHREIVTHSNEWVSINNNKPTLYRYSGWLYLEGHYNGAQIYLFMKTATETGYNTAFDYLSTKEKGKWVYVEKVVLVPPEISKLNLRIDNDSKWYNQNSTAKVWFDDLKIEQLDMSQNEIVSETNYYPFGLAHKGYNEQTTSSNLGENWKYQGQERTPEFGLNIDEWKYRISDPATGRFWQVDPLAESYPYNSTYAFQENKLGLGYELEGLELVYRKGTSPEFKQKYGSVVQYMNEKGTSGMMAKLNTLGRTELVDNTGKGSFYRPHEETIYFDPTAAVETDEGHILSPATVLNHEIDHAVQHKMNTNQMATDLATIDENYSNSEEKRVITGSEQETAKKHGEIKEGEVTRTNHHGTVMDVADPTSTKNATQRVNELQEVIITPKKDEDDKF